MTDCDYFAKPPNRLRFAFPLKAPHCGALRAGRTHERLRPFILLSFSSPKKARKVQETQSYQRIQCIGHTDFNTSGTNAATFVSRDCGGYTLAFTNRIAHSGSHGETRGVSDGGGITTLGAFRTFANIPGPGIRTANFAAFGSWSEALLKNAESLWDSDALMRVAVPRRRGPARLRDPVAVPLTALIGFTILLSRIVAHRKLSACSLVTAVRFLNRCSRRSMRETYPLGQRSGCRF